MSFVRRTSVSFVFKSFKLWPLLLPFILLLPSLNSFPYPSPEAQYSDLTVTHLPYTLFLRRALFEGHTLPLWSPSILSGHPFAANPLSGLWYPPGWLALLLPLPLGFNLLIAAHLVWGGLGTFRLLRAEGLAFPAALFGGVAFALLPKSFAHYGAGHLTLLYAVSWTPWLLYTVAGCRLKVERENPQLSTFTPLPAIILALIFLADPRWAAYSGLLFCFYLFTGGLSNLRMRASAQSPISNLHFLLTQSVLSLLLASPLALPLLQFAQFSTRAHLTLSDIFSFSLPPARLVGLLFPDFRGFHEWMLYPGAVVLALALLSVRLWGGLPQASSRAARFWTWTFGVSLLYSLGSNLPLLTAIGHLPGFDLLRVPSRALFLTGLSLASLAAVSVDRLYTGFEGGERRRANLFLAGIAGFSLALTAGVRVMAGILPVSFGWGAGALTAGVILVGVALKNRLPARVWYSGLLVLACLDLAVVDLSLFAPRKSELVQAEQESLVAYLKSAQGIFRIYSPSYSLPQHAAAQAGLELADGVDPLQLETYAAWMESASGVPRKGYSVTLPPMDSGDPATANVGALPNAKLLGLLNVRYVAAAYDLPVNGLDLVGRFGTTRLYENALALPRAWIQPDGVQPGMEAEAVEILNRTPNRIEISIPSEGSPGLRRLVLSELDYPGWRAWMDGEQMEIRAEAGLLRSILLPPGPHRVVFAFYPASLYWGLALYGCAILIILVRNTIQDQRKDGQY